jgi:hypothetical protein
MKTSELEGAQLDYWVARAENINIALDTSAITNPNWHHRTVVNRDTKKAYCPSTDWAHGGPIIERERIDLEFMDDAGWIATISAWNVGWICEHLIDVAAETAPTPLVAAMRAYVASKFGEEVPDEVTP